MTTVNTSDEKILKEDLVQDIYLEGNAVKVYDKIYGLTNLGRSYFCTYEEVMKKAEEADKQMMQKYGIEIYGKNSTSGGGLILCTVSKLKELPDKFFEASGDFSKLNDAMKKFQDWIENASKNTNWKDQNKKDIDKINANIQAFRPASGPNGAENQKAWNEINEVLKQPNWVGWTKTDKSLDKSVKALRDGWDMFNGIAPGTTASGGGGGTAEKKQTISEEDRKWNPKIPLRIDIQTNFDENWYKKKFKSGLLNKMIMGLKTSAMASYGQGGQSIDKMAGHKYTADEMLPQDVKKLDKLQWNMTNKVAKDYISLLLGWSRDKKMIKNEKGDGNMPFVNLDGMKMDTAFGQKMAEKALGNRGIMGRLKQQIFAGGQSNNVISVAFQFADPNDGWQLVDESGNPIEGDGEEEGEGENGEGGEGENGEGGENGNGAAGTGGANGGQGTGGSGGGTGAGAGGNGGGSGGGGTTGGAGSQGGGGNGANGANGGSGSNGANGSNTVTPADPNNKEFKKLLTLLQRVERLEKEVGIGPGSQKKDDDDNKADKGEKKQANESTDPFADLFDERNRLVRKACDGSVSAGELVDGFLSE